MTTKPKPATLQALYKRREKIVSTWNGKKEQLMDEISVLRDRISLRDSLLKLVNDVLLYSEFDHPKEVYDALEALHLTIIEIPAFTLLDMMAVEGLQIPAWMYAHGYDGPEATLYVMSADGKSACFDETKILGTTKSEYIKRQMRDIAALRELKLKLKRTNVTNQKRLVNCDANIARVRETL